ncbi:mitogen-activated protein kinase-binding protein 1-like isoform X2 [Oscarella lobularis]|uniref:mitogen-activated protein kinase-binding protein 1-like isoform X2 n=1 Tax=Oscarella lobularis TaxID=121494 RepID=UPI003313E54B
MADSERSGPTKIIKRVRRKSRTSEEKIKLEKVIGITASTNSCLSANSTYFAYPAGCVAVLYNAKKNKQRHVHNQARKPLSCIELSPDGKLLATGESGHNPCVRVYDMASLVTSQSGPNLVAELRGHKHGISCLAFSPNMKYIVSVGYEHDKNVNVWQWKTGVVKVATNKISTKVRGLSFSEDGAYFVTVGTRHVRFWYLNTDQKKKQLNLALPLHGRNGILGEHIGQRFTAVACGRGNAASSTFCVTKTGQLIEFNSKREPQKLVELKVSSAGCVLATETYVICGCSEGVIRLFDPSTLKYICSLPRPHSLGVIIPAAEEDKRAQTPAKYPDVVCLSMDVSNMKLGVVYSDHSFYVWNIGNLSQVTLSGSFLSHRSCIWNIEPFSSEPGIALPANSFITGSTDGTVRFWNLGNVSGGGASFPSNIYCKDLLRILYLDQNVTVDEQKNEDEEDSPDVSRGVRSLCLSPDGLELALGDRAGNLKVFDLVKMEERLHLEAHEADVMSIKYSDPESGFRYLASAGRDRLIHVFDVDDRYELVQTIADHSGAVTAIQFSFYENDLYLLSSGTDKSLLFQKLIPTSEPGAKSRFQRCHNVALKSTLYDVKIHSNKKYAALACQDRNVRIYDISSGKLKRSYKAGSDEGTLVKLALDCSGIYGASCSDKTLSLFDFYSGESLARMHGHSDVITDIKFSADMSRLVSVSADSCIFVWKLAPSLTNAMKERLAEIEQHSVAALAAESARMKRRETYSTGYILREEENEEETWNPDVEGAGGDDVAPSPHDHPPLGYRFSISRLPQWAQKRVGGVDATTAAERKETATSLPATQPRGRWAQRGGMESLAVANEFEVETSSVQSEETDARPSSLKLIERRVSAPAICSPLETPEDSSLNDSDDETVQDNPVIYPQGNVGEEGEEFEVTITSPPTLSVQRQDSELLDEPSTEENEIPELPTPSQEKANRSLKRDDDEVEQSETFLKTNFENDFEHLTASVAERIFGQKTLSRQDESSPPCLRHSLSARFLSKSILLGDPNQMRIPAAALQNVTTRLETAADEGDETNAQETLKTTNVSPRSGRKMPTIPNVSSKDLEQRKTEMAQEVEKTRKRLENLGLRVSKSQKEKEVDGSSMEATPAPIREQSPPTKRRSRALPEPQTTSTPLPMAQQARAARRAAKAAEAAQGHQTEAKTPDVSNIVDKAEDLAAAEEPTARAVASSEESDEQLLLSELNQLQEHFRSGRERATALVEKIKQRSDSSAPFDSVLANVRDEVAKTRDVLGRNVIDEFADALELLKATLANNA